MAMRLLEILLDDAGRTLQQGIRQDWNLFEIALIGAGVRAWKKGWRPAFRALPEIRRPWLWALALAEQKAPLTPCAWC